MTQDLSLINTERQLPTQPTAADTADWYRLGDAVEGHGRHMKRQAVAAEYNSGRNMSAWSRDVGLPEKTKEQFIAECKTFGLLGDTPDTSGYGLSEALPTARAAREYAKAEPEVREVIKEIIKEDPEAEVKAAEIKRLRSELHSAHQEVESAGLMVTRLTKEIDESDAWRTEMSTRANANVISTVNGLFAALETLRANEIQLSEAARQTLSTLFTTLSTNDQIHL